MSSAVEQEGRKRPCWRRTVLDIVDRVYVGGAGTPPGTLGQLFAAMDDMRATGAAPLDLSHAERVALGLHRLQVLLRTAGKQSVEARSERAMLRRSTIAWLQDKPLSDFA